ncbi:MAG: hypothetical protein ACI9NY_000806 [Kiritimatiellia bacterium]|jgi:hypothetical protein
MVSIFRGATFGFSRIIGTIIVVPLQMLQPAQIGFVPILGE